MKVPNAWLQQQKSNPEVECYPQLEVPIKLNVKNLDYRKKTIEI